MRVSRNKRSSWVYGVLILMLIALIGFFTLPLLNSVFQTRNTRGVSTVSALSPESQTQLATEAHGYELVLQREPDNFTALRGLLDVRLKQGDLKGTLIPLERLAKLNPSQTEYMVLLAQTKQYLSDYEGAAIAYRSVLTAHPGDMNALQGMVNLFLQQNRPEAAIGLLQDTLKKSNSETGVMDVTAVQLLLGQIYAKQQRYTEAIAIYEQVAEANKEDFRPVLAKALILQEQQKDQEAKPLLLQAVNLAPAKYKDQIKQMADQIPDPQPETNNQ
jgi:tetratricopeptide (TPR) repeat protein